MNATVVDPSSGGAMAQMWVPCVVFAHLFAGYFLLTMLAVMYPSATAAVKRRLGVKARTGASGSGSGSGSGSDSNSGKGSGGSGTQLAVVQGKGAPTAGTARGSNGGSAVLRKSETLYYDCDGGAAAADPELALSSSAAAAAAAAGGSADAVAATGPRSAQSVVLLHKLAALMRPLVMEWQDVGCAYNTASGSKIVLEGIWGRADPGDMVALMGPSGAGKSTLMDILAGRKSVGQLSGLVLVNGKPRREAPFRKATAYVPQEDNFLPTMNVAETCAFYATVLLPRGTSKAARRERTTEVLAAMGLSHTTNTLVGGTLPGGIVLRGLSGGERKRLSIATGILATPSIIFLDEPTSGLDSFAALSVMAYMRSMASTGGQTVIASIHQPRAAIWQLFDKAVLLSMGRMMFCGAREGLVPWFTAGCGYPYDPAMHGLASDWVMDLVNIGFRKPESLFGKMMNSMEELEAAADAFSASYLQQHHPQLLASIAEGTDDGAAAAGAASADAGSRAVSGGGGADCSTGSSARAAGDAEHGRRDQTDVEHGAAGAAAASVASSATSQQQQQQQQQRKGLGWLARRSSSSDGGAAAGAQHSSASWLTQCRILLWREVMNVTRNPADVAGRCLIFTWLAVFVGLIYYNLPSTVDGLRSRLNVLFVQPVILLLLPYVYMSLFTSDKQYFIADVSAKLYRPSAYYVAKNLAVLPFAVLNSLLFALTLYGLAGLRHAAASVGMNALMSVMVYLIAAQVLTLTAVVMPNEDLAFMGAIGWTAINLLLSNFMMRFADMNMHWLSYLRYLSAMGYAFDGYGQAEFAGVAYSCANGLAPSIAGFLPEFLPNTPAIRTPLVSRAINNPGADCTVDMDTVLAYFSLFRPFWQTCVILVAYLVILHLATFGGLLQLTKKERR